MRMSGSGSAMTIDINPDLHKRIRIWKKEENNITIPMKCSKI
jgi:hypothetical protein